MFQPNRSEDFGGTTLHQQAQDYVLGNGIQEQNRLKLQASILEKWTEQFFRSAGLESGMRVLDLGCGMGDVSLLAARLVGPTGSVTGIDRDGVIVEKARERARHLGCGAGIEFIHTSLMDFHAGRHFDAVVGRYFLLYQPDPEAAVLHATKQVRPGGIVVFHEMDFANPIQSYPEGTLFEKMYALVSETFRRAGCPGDLGLRLTALFLNAGVPWPTIRAEVPVGGAPGSYLCAWITETLRSLLPRVEQFGLARADELDLDTLVARMENDAVARHAQLLGPLQLGAWTRIPEHRHEAAFSFSTSNGDREC